MAVSPACIMAPPTTVEALHTADALSNAASATQPRRDSSTATACRVSPMELPLGGPTLRHYTQSRPRPHRQKLNYRPCRPQETIIESENEVLEHMGRVDEGVDEFFSKKVLPVDTLKTQDEESITVHEEAPVSSVSCPPPTKTLRRKLGDFFTLRKRRSLKSEPSLEGRPKKASIADFIRPLREVARADKEKSKIKENDKENEKEKAKDDPCSNAGDSAVQETLISGAPPLRGDAAPPRRALREGKSQSLILLSGSSAGPTNARNATKKQLEGQHSFEQKLHLMLQRIGVSKAQTGETQKAEREMKKAESEGTIIDNKTEPTQTFSKTRTMSASSDTRHQMRSSVSAHESAGKPALPPKPVMKPGPVTSTSGNITPENVLTQIQEGEAITTTKPSPSEATSSPSTAASEMTITNDATHVMIESSSSTAPSDQGTDSVEPTVEAVPPTDVEEPDDKSTYPESSGVYIEKPVSTAATTTPTEIKATDSVTSMPSESVSPSPSLTTNPPPLTIASTTTSEAPPTNGSVVSTSSSSLLEKTPDLGVSSALTGAAAEVTHDKSTPPHSQISDSKPDGFHSTTVSISAVATNSSATNLSATSTTSFPHQSNDIVLTKVLSDDVISCPSLINTTSTTSISTSETRSSESVLTISTSTISQVTECLTSTDEVGPTVPPDLPDSTDTSTTLPSVISSETDDSSSSSQRLNSLAPSEESPRQDDSQICSGDGTTSQQREKDEKSAADEKPEVSQESRQLEKKGTITVNDGHEDSGDCNNKQAPADEMIAAVQGATVKPDDAALTTEWKTVESPSTTECQNQETKQASG